MKRVDFATMRRGAASGLASIDWRVGLAALIAVNLAVAAFVPIYIDELVYKLASARTLFERGAQISLYPQCPDTFVTRVPLPLLPGGVVYALVWQNLTLLGMRFVSILMFGVWLVLLHMLVRQLVPPRHSRLTITLGAAALLSLGVTGFTMAISRPEGFSIIALTAIALLPLVAPGFLSAAPSVLSRRLRILGTAALFLLLVSTLAFGHPNVVYFIPFIAVSVTLTFRGSSLLLLVAIMAIIVWTVVTGVTHSTRVIATCDDPAFRGMLNMYLMDIKEIWTAPAETIKALIWNAAIALRQVVHYAAHAKEHQSSWLPPTPALGWLPLSVGLRWVMEAVWYMIALAGVAAIAVRLRDWRSEASAAPALLAAGLLLGFGALFAHARQLNFTIVQLALPMLIVFGLLTLSPWIPRALDSRAAGPAAAALSALVALSVAINLVFIAPQLVGPAFSETFFNDKQHHSYGAWNQQARDDATRRLADRCGIAPGRAPNLLVDDVSYNVFRHDRQPIFAMYVNPGHLGAGIAGRQGAFFRSIRTSGFIGKCNYLWHEFHAIAIRDGDACCVSAEALAGAR